MPDAYAVSPDTLRISLSVPRGQAGTVWVHYGDRYARQRPLAMMMSHQGMTASFDVFQADISVATGRFQYLFEIQLFTGETMVYGEDGVGRSLSTDRPFQFAAILHRDLYSVPSWSTTAVCYEIFPDRFLRYPTDLKPPSPSPLAAWDSTPTSSSFFGGTLAGIIQKLPYLAELGISLIYLTPIFASRSNHRYDTDDYYRIDPMLGTPEDLKKLVREAHQRGIRVMLDAVFNHSSSRFFAFQDVVAKGKRSPYWDWYFIKGSEVSTKPLNYQTFANGIANMPKLNFANPAVEAYFLEVARHWIREAGIDGWRLDVANEVDHRFWRTFREAIKQEFPECLIVGEVWHDPLPWVQGDQFDGVMNYRLRNIVDDFFVQKKISVTELASRLDDLRFSLPSPALSAGLNLVGSHDTERVLTWVHEDEEAYLAILVLLFSWQGIPMIYYGDEIGMLGGTDPLCRGGMQWDRNPGKSPIFRAIQALIGLRAQYGALRGEKLTIEHALASQHILQYRRQDQDGSELVITINLSPSPISLPASRSTLFSTAASGFREKLPPRHAEIWIAQ